MKRLNLIILLWLAIAPFISHAQPLMEEPYIAGKDYAVIDKPVRTRSSDTVEVVEVFWYGCSHCYRFKPLVTQWKNALPDDVDFWQSPAIWNDSMQLHAQAFYTAQALGVLDSLHEALFKALIVERKPLNKPQAIEALFVDYGVAPEDFRKTFNAFGIESQVKQAQARTHAYQISGTPELMINGKYRVSGRLASSQQKMLDIASFLIDKERAAKHEDAAE